MEFKVLVVCFAFFVVTVSGASVLKYEEEDKKDLVLEVTSGEVDVVYDFEKNLTMHRMPNQKACFLSDLTTSLPKPEVLAKLLERDNSQGPIQDSSEYLYVVAGTVNDRSILNDEMAALCAKSPIYRIKEKSLMFDVEKQKPLQRVKRNAGVNLFRCRNTCTGKVDYAEINVFYNGGFSTCRWDCQKLHCHESS